MLKATKLLSKLVVALIFLACVAIVCISHPVLVVPMLLGIYIYIYAC
jgi:hypothetical protein